MQSKVNSRTKLNWHIEANRKTGKKQRIKRKLAQSNCDKGRQLVDGQADLDRQLQLKRDTVKSSKMRQMCSIDNWVAARHKHVEWIVKGRGCRWREN